MVGVGEMMLVGVGEMMLVGVGEMMLVCVGEMVVVGFGEIMLVIWCWLPSKKKAVGSKCPQHGETQELKTHQADSENNADRQLSLMIC